MSDRAGMGAKMLEREALAKESTPADDWQNELVELDHKNLLTRVRQINVLICQELLSSLEVPQELVLDGAPVPISTRQFCKLMGPFICLN